MLIGPIKGSVPLIFGKNPTIHILILSSICIYIYLGIFKPEIMRKSVRDSMITIKRLGIFILSALFIAGAVKTLIQGETLAGYLGKETGLIGVFLGVVIGAILPACPFVSYPIISGIYLAGAGFPGIMGMLFGAGLVFPCYLSCDIMFFNYRILIKRVTLSFLAAIISGSIVFLLFS